MLDGLDGTDPVATWSAWDGTAAGGTGEQGAVLQLQGLLRRAME